MDLDELRQAAARRILAILRSHLWIAPTDRPQPYPGRVTFFAAAEQPLEAGDDPAHGWGEVAGEIEVHRGPGSHTTMIYDPENVKVLGERLRLLSEGFVPRRAFEERAPG